MRDAIASLQKGTVIPASPLVLDDHRAFDPEGQRLLTRYYCEAGVGGLAVAVHTTQFEIRLPQHNLFETVLSTVVDEINRFETKAQKTVVKIAGVCGPVSQAVAEARLAKRYGYDAVLLSPGGLQDLGEDELLKRAVEVAKVIPILGFYLQPLAGGRVFSYDYWVRFCQLDNVVAIKIAPFNRYQTLDVVRAVALSGKDIALYTGNDDNIVIDLLTEYDFGQGAKVRFVGGLLGHWSVWAHTVVKLFEKIRREGVTAEMLKLANEVTDCNAAFFDSTNKFAGCIAGLHEVLRRQGLMKGILCLNPSETLSPGQKEEIDRVYALYPHLNDDEFVREFLARESNERHR